MPVEVITFQEALEQTEGQKRHLLLGNGFSIALFPTCFRYDSLLISADEEGLFDTMPEAREVFNAVGTQDFEEVIASLRKAAQIIPHYSDDADFVERMNGHADSLKEILVQTIAGRHPERPSDITEAQYTTCREFLANFVGERRDANNNDFGKDLRGNIFSLNYDLLLYWALLHDQILFFDEDDPLSSRFEDGEELQHDDGFRASEIEPEAPYVAWDGEGGANSQNIHYLHGALHLFDDGPELEKYCWERSGGIPLIDQVRDALDRDFFPLFVAEGTSLEKLEKIRHSGYLQRSLRCFNGVCRASRGSTCLFIFGHSLHENDQHILKQISKGSIRKVYISLFGDPGWDSNRRAIAAANRLVGDRSRNPLEVIFYSAETANVWG